MPALSTQLSRKLANMAVISSWLVVYIHIASSATEGTFDWWGIQLFRQGICRIAVPFFFVASGFFLSRHVGEVGWWHRALKTRIGSLLVPFVIWELMYVLCLQAITCLANPPEVAARALLDELRAWPTLLGIQGGAFPRNGPLWFVRALLLYVLIAPVLVAPLRRSKRWAMGFLVVLAVAYGPLCRSASCACGRSFPKATVSQRSSKRARSLCM